MRQRKENVRMLAQFDKIIGLIRQTAKYSLVDAMSGRHNRLPVHQSATALVFGYLDVHLVGELAVPGALAADDPALGRLYGPAADW